MTEQEIYRKAVKVCGRDAQMGMLQEECAEVIQAVNKLRRGALGAADNLCEEIADVEIMLAQMRCVLPENRIEFFKKLKLERLEKMLEG